MALRDGAIDWASFTAIRLASGALVLAPLLFRRSLHVVTRPNLAAPLALFIYAAAFSLAYRAIGAGAGALILFGSVQATMFARAALAGEKFSAVELAGIAAALTGLVVLTAPGLSAPPPGAALLMATAGAAWGAYTLIGRGAGDPARATAWNFLLAAPLGLALLILPHAAHLSAMGVALAAASGAIASAGGYVIWYIALGGLTRIRASVMQLSVPFLTALGGAMLLGEPITLRVIAAGFFILGGVFAVVSRKSR